MFGIKICYGTLFFTSAISCCLAISNQYTWPVSVRLENLTGEKLICNVPRLQEKGFSIKNFSLEPFQSAGFISIETDKRPVSSIWVKWINGKKENFSQQIFLKFPICIEKKPEILKEICFNFDLTKCFVSFVIEDQNFLFHRSEILSDGTLFNCEVLKKKNGKDIPTGTMRTMRISSENSEDQHYQHGILVILGKNHDWDEPEFECNIEIDIICRKIYVRNNKLKKLLDKYLKANTPCYYGIFPFLRKKEFILNGTWHILAE